MTEIKINNFFHSYATQTYWLHSQNDGSRGSSNKKILHTACSIFEFFESISRYFGVPYAAGACQWPRSGTICSRTFGNFRAFLWCDVHCTNTMYFQTTYSVDSCTLYRLFTIEKKFLSIFEHLSLLRSFLINLPKCIYLRK